MLGLGSGLTTLSLGSYNLIYTYTSDFTTSDLDGWEADSVQNSSSDLTLTSNVDGFDGQDNWLKAEFGVTQTNFSGIKNPLIAGQYQKDDIVEVNISSVHFVDDNNKWGSDNTVLVLVNDGVHSHTGLGTVGTSGPINPAYSSGQTFVAHAKNDTSDVELNIGFVLSPDFPQAGAVFYIKDIELKVYRLNG